MKVSDVRTSVNLVNHPAPILPKQTQPPKLLDLGDYGNKEGSVVTAGRSVGTIGEGIK